MARFIVIAAVLLIGLIGLSVPGRAETVDRNALLSMLAAGQYDEIDRQLDAINDEANAGKRPERDLTRAFGAFETSDPAVTAEIERWVKERPTSAMALTARGVHRFHLIEITRFLEPFAADDAAYAHSLRNREFEAFIDVQQAIGLKETIPIGFQWSIEASVWWGIGQDVERWYRVAIDDLPRSAMVQRSYLSSFVPWRQSGVSWEMSFSHLEATLKSMQKAFGKDPDFAWLAGYLEYVKGETDRLQDRPEEALKHFQVALAASEDPQYRLASGRANLTLGHGEAALGDFEAALQSVPESAAALHGRALAKETLGRQNEALADLDAAIELDPYNPLYLTDRARFLHAARRDDEARNDIDKALTFGEHDPWVQAWRGALYETVNAEVAAAAFARAATLAPSRSAYLKPYAQFLLRHADCAAIPVVAHYDEVCDVTEDCGATRLKLDDAAGQLRTKSACME